MRLVNESLNSLLSASPTSVAFRLSPSWRSANAWHALARQGYALASAYNIMAGAAWPCARSRVYRASQATGAILEEAFVTTRVVSSVGTGRRSTAMTCDHAT